jgi:DNA-binding NarL/FixJ family response regulator
MPPAAHRLQKREPQRHNKKMANPTSVLLIHENDAEAEAIARELTASAMEVTRVPAATREAVVAALADTKPDVVISDHSPERFSACEVMDVVRYERPETAVIVVAETVTGLAAVSCLRAGVEDLVLKKNIKRLPEAIVRAMEKRRALTKLTSRQIEVLRLVAEGRRTREIAERLNLSVKTVESHRGEVMKRLEMHDVVSLVRYALRVGLIPATS